MTTALRHCLLFACALLCFLFGAEARADDAPLVTARSERLSFAVVIGNNKSLGRRRPDLHYADDDAARYFEILQTIAPGRVSLLADFDRDTQRLFPKARAQASSPTRKNLEAAGRRLGQQVRAAQAAGHETEVYFIFAGHGDVAKGEGFIEMADERFRSSELKAWLKAIPFTRAHVILDSCNSFFMLGVRKPGGRHFATSEDATRALAAQLPNVGVFLSTSAEGEAFEWSEIQSGIFSHVVRSGLLGAADADEDGSVSYLELAAFVDTATANVKNPNMRPHVFARGPGGKDQAAIAHLLSMTSVRRFELGDAGSLRLRLRDAEGVPLLDAHTEHSKRLVVVLPEAWASGAVIERLPGGPSAKFADRPRTFYAVPAAPGTVTLAALEAVDPTSAVRGPDETFQTLFAEPFGPLALGRYVASRGSEPPPVYGVSKEDTERMELVLDQLSRTERGKRLNESIGGIGCGVLLTGAGIGVLHGDTDSSEETERLVLGGSLLGAGGLFVFGSTVSLFALSPGEQAAREFHQVIAAGGDPTQAFAAADKRIQEVAKIREEERWGMGVIGGIVLVGSTTGLVWSEFAADEGDSRMAPRLGWGAGMLVGVLMLGEAILMDTSSDILTKIWRDDPSLNQYQPSVRLNPPSLGLTTGGAFLSLSGTL